MRIASLSTSLRLMDGSDADMDEFLRFVPLAEGLRARWLRVFDGGQKCNAAELNRAAELVERWRRLRASHGWKADMMVETHDALSTSGAIERLVASIPDVRILWDTHHTWRTGGEAPSETWRAIGPSVVHMHVKDSQMSGSPGDRPCYRLPGTGDFPMTELRNTIEGCFSGALSLEWERMWHPELPPLEKALSAASTSSWW